MAEHLHSVELVASTRYTFLIADPTSTSPSYCPSPALIRVLNLESLYFESRITIFCIMSGLCRCSQLQARSTRLYRAPAYEVPPASHTIACTQCWSRTNLQTTGGAVSHVLPLPMAQLLCSEYVEVPAGRESRALHTHGPYKHLRR